MFFGPFSSKTQAARLELPDGELLLGYNGRVIEMQLGEAPPRLTFISQFKVTWPGWSESPELRFAGVVARQWVFDPGPGANALICILLHLQQNTISIRFCRTGTGLSGTYYVHEGLKPLAFTSLGFKGK